MANVFFFFDRAYSYRVCVWLYTLNLTDSKRRFQTNDRLFFLPTFFFPAIRFFLPKTRNGKTVSTKITVKTGMRSFLSPNSSEMPRFFIYRSGITGNIARGLRIIFRAFKKFPGASPKEYQETTAERRLEKNIDCS